MERKTIALVKVVMVLHIWPIGYKRPYLPYGKHCKLFSDQCQQALTIWSDLEIQRRRSINYQKSKRKAEKSQISEDSEKPEEQP